MARLAKPSGIEFVCTERPFSGFDFAEARFAGSPPIRRLFSLGRSKGARSLIVEAVEPEGPVLEENDDITSIAPDHSAVALIRVSFWKKAVKNHADFSSLTSRYGIGYAILKHDEIPSRGIDSWHVFEAVFIGNKHHHNYLTTSGRIRFRCGQRHFSVTGSLYAQQNAISKACAQVALRSLCATYLNEPDLSFRKINDLASGGDPSFVPSAGLNSTQIAAVLKGLGIPYAEINYEANPSLREPFPYQKLVYSGVESGCGALLGFRLSGPAAPAVGHVIPYVGHTFNEDAWAPHADVMYFTVGKTIEYVPSRAWMSSFLVHDDNFGANLCIPQNFVHRDNVGYAVELLPRGYSYSGALAEIVASQYFYSLLPALFSSGGNTWLRRLVDYVNQQRLILRCVPITLAAYVKALGNAEDWEGMKEDPTSITDLTNINADKLWMIEVSVPEVFSTNKRKLGEILLDAEHALSDKIDGASFVLARFPENYVFFSKVTPSGTPTFLTTPSKFRSHLPLLRRT